MSDKKTLTFALMDAPFESARSTTALRMMNVAAQRGWNINVFAYEGAVYLPFTEQKAHANAVHGRDVEEEDHPLPKEWVKAIKESCDSNGGEMDWVNCGLCVDERGANQTFDWIRRGTPGDLLKMADASDNTLIIGTRG
jgi:tRNA 2-thiouridine synthesizing protein D